MSGQMALDFRPPLPEPVTPPTLRQQAEQWLADNPGLYAEIVRRVREVKAAGGRVGMKAVFERIRWDQTIRVSGADWKMNNTWAAPVAAIVDEREPDLRGFFEFRGRQHVKEERNG